MRFERCLAEPGNPERFQLIAAPGRGAMVVPAAGMNLVSVGIDGREMLRLPIALEEFMSTQKTGGVPLLHPWANRLRGDIVEHAGVSVDLAAVPGLKRDGNGLPMHGLLLRFDAWELDHGTDGDEAWIEGRIDWPSFPGLMAAFPFPHRLRIRWTLRSIAGGLQATCIHEVEAREIAVPLAAGWHPYLAPGPGSHAALQVETPTLRPVALDDQGLPCRDDAGDLIFGDPIDQSGPLGSRQFDDLHRAPDGGWKCAISSPDGGRIEFEADSNWPWLQLYSPRDADFMCFEPMLAPTAALSDGAALVVAAGTVFQASFTIRFTV
ncbi:MAG: aldose 1-epimerase [Planctomycetota bacterium]|nr:aldose 1-epimerase [Planctomycetota bacterium]